MGMIVETTELSGGRDRSEKDGRTRNARPAALLNLAHEESGGLEEDLGEGYTPFHCACNWGVPFLHRSEHSSRTAKLGKLKRSLGTWFPPIF